MISLVESIPNITAVDAALAKIKCTAESYINYPNISLFWCQGNDHCKPDSLISLIDGSMCIYRKKGDIDELKHFVDIINPQQIFTDLATAKLLNLKINTVCSGLFKNPPHSNGDGLENTYAGVDFLLEKLSSRLPINESDEIRADISHRLRHSTAAYVTSPYSAALLFHGYDSAVITGIAVDKDKERCSIGTSTLKKLLEYARNRCVYACCEEENTQFYLKNGFKMIGFYAYAQKG